MFRSLLILPILASLAGCANAPSSSPVMGQKSFVLERDLAGRNIAKGVFKNALTGAERRLTAILDGRWNGKSLTLSERFLYEDGERQHKTWVLTRTGPGTFSGTREDVVGTAVGRQDGTDFRLSYDVLLPSGGSTLQVHFEDVLALQGDGTILNQAFVSKLGVRVGTVVLTIGRK